MFEASIKPCNEALTEIGYKHKIRYQQDIRQNTSTTKNRKKKYIMVQSIISTNVVSKVGKLFLSLLDKPFLPNNKLNKIFRRNIVKIGYSCMLNVKIIINSHNHKIDNFKTITKERTCNCIDAD